MTSRKTISLNTFRMVERMEESMIRTVMPRTAEADAQHLNSFGFERTHRNGVRIARADGVTLVKPLTFTLSEVR